MSEAPVITRVRHELKRRRLTVARVENRAAGMKRVVLTGSELAGFTSLGFDDHVKLIFPDGAGGQALRDFTPRRFDPASGELWIDFFLHEAGPASEWARQVEVGATLEVGGPKGSAVIASDGIDCHLLIGDETALPAIERRLEELQAPARAIVLLEIEAGAERPALKSNVPLDVSYVSRGREDSGRGREEGADAGALITALKNLQLPTERCFAWIAHETQTARAVRAYLHQERGFDKKWIKAAGYWRRGAIGAHENIGD